MRFLRFVFPFLFVRNWYNGMWELSGSRVLLFGAFLMLFCSAVVAIVIMNLPVEYIAPGSEGRD